MVEIVYIVSYDTACYNEKKKGGGKVISKKRTFGNCATQLISSLRVLK